MEYTFLLLLFSINTVFCYYFYNPTMHDLITRTSLRNVPKGYKLVPPPRDRKQRLTKGKTNGQCTDGGFTCTTPYLKSATLQFECASDDQCPTNYKCCPQRCFLHKICLKTSNTPVTYRNRENCPSKQREGECEKWPYNCRRPYHYSLTQRFKCNRDTQCPRNFNCCQQSCFTHKICSRVKTQGTKPPINVIDTNTEEETEGEQNGNNYETEGEEETEITLTTEEADYEDREIEITTEEELEITEGDLEENRDTTEPDIEAGANNVEEEEETDITEDEQDIAESDVQATTEADTNNVEEEEEETDITEDEQDINETDVQATTEADTNNVEEEEEEETDITEDEPETIEAESEVTTAKVGVQTTTSYVPLTTLDSNAINPEYAEYYYHYDNGTDTQDESVDDEEDEYDYSNENEAE